MREVGRVEVCFVLNELIVLFKIKVDHGVKFHVLEISTVSFEECVIEVNPVLGEFPLAKLQAWL